MPLMIQYTTVSTQTVQMLVTGKVNNRLERGSCDLERRKEAGRTACEGRKTLNLTLILGIKKRFKICK